MHKSMNVICKGCQHQKLGGGNRLICGVAPSETTAHGIFTEGASCIYDANLVNQYIPRHNDQHLEDAKNQLRIVKEQVVKLREGNYDLKEELEVSRKTNLMLGKELNAK